MPDPLDLAKEALAQIGTRSKIVSLTDGSAEAQYINLLYAPIRDFLLTEGDYDWSMRTANLVVAGGPNPPPSPPWNYGYVYPVDALRIRQLFPSNYSPSDPRPTQWTIGYDAGLGARVIYTLDSMLRAHYTSNFMGEEVWDAIFRQSFVRMLASALAFALENRIEASKLKLDEALGFAGIARTRDM